MKEGPDISVVAALIGNPACANMLTALMAGPALTATELSQEAGLTLSTVSGHLTKLEKASLVTIERQGRHRYYRLADPDVATALEALMPLAARAGHLRIRTGPRDPELRRARSCYDHLAGDLAVAMYDRFLERRLMTRRGAELRITEEGRRFFAKSGIDLDEPGQGRRPLCRPCLDWSERRAHLSGILGAAIFDFVLARGWAARERKTRVVRFSPTGEQKMRAWFSR
jgi:DNA-binding transcriptional ArsR family regulator